MPGKTYDKKIMQWDRFCLEYAHNGHNGAQAALAAGYAKSSARVQANRMLKEPYVINKIAEIENSIEEKKVMSFYDILEKFQGVMEDAESKGMEIIAAGREYSKLMGYYEKDNAQKNPFKPEPPAPKRDLPDECK